MLIKNWERIKEYYEAWWNGEVLDRVPLMVTAPRGNSQDKKVIPGTVEDRLNKEKNIDYAEKQIQNTFYGGVAFPQYWPNLGTDVFSAYMGAILKFSPLGSSSPASWVEWNKPVLKEYPDLSMLQIQEDNFYWQKTKEFISYALARSQGEYLVGITDLHGGMDALTALRGGPQQLCIDLVDNPDGVKKAMKFLWKIWHRVYEESYRIIAKGQEGTSSWINLWSPGRNYPVQNDFTCLISSSMYKEFFLEEIMNEINYLDYSIYHLDGPDALKHLDLLLEIPSLNAIQWVAGSGLKKEGVAKWIPIYRKIQAKKKSIIVYPRPEEVNFVLENLAPGGLLIASYCSSEKEAKELLARKGWR
ncbi:MAG: hypothetical protein KAX20_02575 [Candidatus Omnitrophica bacterium]|nr:hypothetical protein [Candidatus Omnitrophota bacterium]